ncbi:MAG: exodeoxyribonuclease VII large subunit [Candidatus Moranbacteria bacterium]|nr:exodeoxyribonuclease VII large subunit [Candidatus Moranbacteria bacterium]
MPKKKSDGNQVLPLFESSFKEKEAVDRKTKIKIKQKTKKKKPVPKKNKRYRVLIEKKGEKEKKEKKEKVFSVGQFLNLVNDNLENIQVRVKGEVGKVQHRGNYSFFTLKDSTLDSTMNCFVWANVIKVCGVEIEEGLELVVDGFMQIFKRTGSVSFQVKSIELVGEGALMKAFEELKKKLEREGLFEAEIKKEVPFFPEKIALITSRHGEAINDFNMNIGNFGFKIEFVDARVEGQRAVFDLIRALELINKRSSFFDAVVLIRGGGSWESLQAFNNEELARKIRASKIPVICGVGHEGDVTIADLVSDFRASTPTAAAKKLSENWSKTREKVARWENIILNEFDYMLNQKYVWVNEYANALKSSFLRILENFRNYEDTIKRGFEKLSYRIKQEQENLKINQDILEKTFEANLKDRVDFVQRAESAILNNDPRRQLKLGYSIVMKGEEVIKSVDRLLVDDVLEVKIYDGELKTRIKKIIKRSENK